MKEKNKRKKKHGQSNLIDPRVFLLLILSPFFTAFLIINYERFHIVKNGIQTDAYVYKITHAEKHAYIYTYCHFEYNGLRYTAAVRNHYKIGDKIQVLFLPKKPTRVIECDGVIRHSLIFKQRVKKGEIVLKE